MRRTSELSRVLHKLTTSREMKPACTTPDLKGSHALRKKHTWRVGHDAQAKRRIFGEPLPFSTNRSVCRNPVTGRSGSERLGHRRHELYPKREMEVPCQRTPATHTLAGSSRNQGRNHSLHSSGCFAHLKHKVTSSSPLCPFPSSLTWCSGETQTRTGRTGH